MKRACWPYSRLWADFRGRGQGIGEVATVKDSQNGEQYLSEKQSSATLKADVREDCYPWGESHILKERTFIVGGTSLTDT